MHNDPIRTQADSEYYLNQLAEQARIRSSRIPGVRSVLVVLSAAGMAADLDGLRQKIFLAYPDTAIFICCTRGKPIGAVAPKRVDLLIDFTGPGQRQCFLMARRLRRKARVAVGRNAGFFRKKIYDRIVDEKDPAFECPQEVWDREAVIQRKVLALAGIASVPIAASAPDRGRTIALELPPLARL